MDAKHTTSLVAFLLLLQALTVTYAVLTVEVTADECDNEYQIHFGEEINLIFDNSVFKNSSSSPYSGDTCYINFHSACNNCQICVYNKVIDDSFCSGFTFMLFYGYKPISSYDSHYSFTCFETDMSCTELSMVSAQFRPSTRLRNRINVQLYVQEITTTEKPTTTPYVYKSSKGRFDPIASLLIPVGVVIGVCGLTCLAICCVLICRKVCKDEDIPAPTHIGNNEELQHLNNPPATLPSAPIYTNNQNQIPLQPQSYGPGYPGNPQSYGPGHPGNPQSYGPGHPGNPQSYGPGYPGYQQSYRPGYPENTQSYGPGYPENPQSYGPGYPGNQQSYGPGSTEDQSSDNNPNEPPDYEKALLSSTPTKQTENDTTIDTKDNTMPPPPRYYPGM